MTFGLISFMERFIQLTSRGSGVPLAQLPFLAYYTSLRKSSLLSDLVEALFGLAFIAATIRSASVFVRVLSLTSLPIMRSSVGMCAAYFETLPTERLSALM